MQNLIPINAENFFLWFRSLASLAARDRPARMPFLFAVSTVKVCKNMWTFKYNCLDNLAVLRRIIRNLAHVVHVFP